MDDWEKLDDDESIPRISSPQDDRWDGEDADLVVKENWDDEDPVESPEESSKSESSKDPTKPKANKPKTAKEKRDEKKRLEEEERARIAANKVPRTAEEMLADKVEQERRQKESDLALAMESLGGGRTTSPGTVVSFEDVMLSSREDFESFTKNLVEKMGTVSSSPFYVPFLEDLFRDLCVGLEPDDVKRLSASLNALFNEKVKAQKGDKKSKKKGPKVTIKLERDELDLEGGKYDEKYDDMDDFM